MYSKNKGQRSPPTPQDMRDITAGTRQVNTDFMSAPPSVPSYADLLKTFDESNDEDEYFDNSAPLAGAVAEAPKKMAASKPLSMVKKHHASIASPPPAPAAVAPSYAGNSNLNVPGASQASSAPGGGPPPVPAAAMAGATGAGPRPGASPKSLTQPFFFFFV